MRSKQRRDPRRRPTNMWWQLCFWLIIASAQAETPMLNKPKIALAVHGGAGTINRAEMTPALEQEYRAGLEKALVAGKEILLRGGTALDAVETAVRTLEDNPLFNAGKGAVFTSAGTNELDASIMNGKTLAVGAVAGLEHVRSPISLARRVMENSKHVFLSGTGAEEFARAQGIELVDPKYFFTQRRWDELQKAQAKQKGDATPKPGDPAAERHGTVGAVALDQHGDLAAATSTGGNVNKLPGRIGDSPVIGAGTYADNKSCAVSCTGDGEYFIRAAVAHEVAALIELRGLPLKEAADGALARAKDLGGTGGLIAVGKDGNIALPFNTSGMYRGYLAPEGNLVTAIYREP